MRLARVALRIAAALQFAGGVGLTIEVIVLLIRERTWTTFCLILLGLLALLGAVVARLAVAVWRRDPLAWGLSLLPLGVAVFLTPGIGGGFWLPRVTAVLFIAGAPALMFRQPVRDPPTARLISRDRCRLWPR